MNQGDDLSNKVERLEALEERLEVRLEAVSAFVENLTADEMYISLRGEVRPASGYQLSRNLEIRGVLYDAAGRVVGTSNETCWASWLYGFDTFELMLTFPVGVDVNRVRLYPEIHSS